MPSKKRRSAGKSHKGSKKKQPAKGKGTAGKGQSKRKAATSKKPSKRKSPSTPSRRTPAKARTETFVTALAALLRERNLEVPEGLEAASGEAYAHQPPEHVEALKSLADEELAAHAERVAAYERRRIERVQRAWDDSPLIVELRRRRLVEPPRPTRVVGAAFSLKKPLAEWSDDEILQMAMEWSRRGS